MKEKKMKQFGKLQIEHDLDFIRNEKRVQRVGFYMLLLVLAAALLGIFGSGPLSQGRAKNGGMTVRYERFSRMQSPQEMEITTRPGAGGLRVWISSRYLEHVEIQKMTPEPAESIAGDDGVTFVFEAEKESGPVPVKLHLNVQKPGIVGAEIRSGKGEAVVFRQIVYP